MSSIIWKTLLYNGYTYDKFEVSNDGKLRNAKTGRVYKTSLIGSGYYSVCVSLGSRKQKKVFKIHKAVAETFIPNPENKKIVNHIDGNKQNNLVSNLEWVTISENTKHAFDIGLNKQEKGTDSPFAKLSEEDVNYIRSHYIPYDKEYGTRGLGRKFNVSHDTICDVIHYNTYVNI